MRNIKLFIVLWLSFLIFIASSVRVYSCHVVRANSFKIILGGKEMPDSDKKIKHFVVSRFFPFQRKEFPHNILDVDFLSKQLPLAKNMLRSLENQTNKKFELVFIANPKFFDDPKYEFIFSTLRDSTTLPLKFIKWSEVTTRSWARPAATTSWNLPR